MGRVGASPLLPGAPGRSNRQRCRCRRPLDCCPLALAVWLASLAAALCLAHLVPPASRLGGALVLLKPGSSWALSRCLGAWLLGGARRKVDCLEAWAHVHAQAVNLPGRAHDRVPPQPLPPPLHYVHFILTKPLHGSARDLAWCALEAAEAFSAAMVPPPEVRLWVENHTPRQQELLQQELRARGLRASVASFVESLLLELNGTRRLPPGPGLPRLEAWIAAEHVRLDAYAFGPALFSDAYRVAILGRFGGLYLDLDMVPMSRGLLHIPDGSLVLQDHKAKAFVINGGVMRLDRGSRFLQLLEQDWLAYIGLYEQSPRWGLLGPAQLTRAYLRSGGAGLHLFAAHLFEPRSVKAVPAQHRQLCQHLEAAAAIHFSGRAKDKPAMPELSTPCVAERLAASCPRTAEECTTRGWGAGHE